MNKIDYIKAQVQKIVPLVFEDSLSYYELLSKVVKTLNDVIKRTNDLDDNIKEEVTEVVAELLESGELGTAVMQAVGNLVNRVSAAENSISSLTKKAGLTNIVNLKGKTIVFFGDSWTVGSGADDRTTEKYSTRVAAALNMVERNFGVGGAGFCTPNTFISQVETAAISMTANDRSEVPVVVLIGGVNDMRTWEANQITNDLWQDAITAVTSRMHDVFPNALVVIGLCNTTLNYVTATWIHRIEVAKRRAVSNRKFPILVMENVHNWIRGFSLYYTSDGLHPNSLGHGVFAGKVVNAILGGDVNVDYYVGSISMDDSINMVVQTPGHMFRRNNDIVITNAEYTFDDPITENTKIGTIPVELTGLSNVYFPVYSGNVVAGSIAIVGSTGDVRIIPNEGKSLSHIYTPMLQWFLVGQGNRPA